MNIEELENKIKELQKELEALKNKKKNKRWRAEVKGEYYRILSDLDTDCTIDCYARIDNDCYMYHNYFRTEEEAQGVVDNIKTNIELFELTEELNTEPIDWENYKQEKYFMKYNYYTKEIDKDFCLWSKIANVIYCTNSNFKDEAIKRIGEERLIKYLKR